MSQEYLTLSDGRRFNYTKSPLHSTSVVPADSVLIEDHWYSYELLLEIAYMPSNLFPLVKAPDEITTIIQGCYWLFIDEWGLKRGLEVLRFCIRLHLDPSNEDHKLYFKV